MNIFAAAMGVPPASRVHRPREGLVSARLSIAVCPSEARTFAVRLDLPKQSVSEVGRGLGTREVPSFIFDAQVATHAFIVQVIVEHSISASSMKKALFCTFPGRKKT